MCGWFKYNSDGAARGNPSHAASGGIFRDSRGAILGCFANYIGVASSLEAELCAAMSCIEIAFEKGWTNIWLESNPVSVIQSFKYDSIRWHKCLALTTRRSFFASHVYREGNSCADGLAIYGTLNHCFTWWDLVPSFIKDDFYRNRFFLPSYRFR